MLCCDAFGVLPPVAKLSKEQAGWQRWKLVDFTCNNSDGDCWACSSAGYVLLH